MVCKYMFQLISFIWNSQWKGEGFGLQFIFPTCNTCVAWLTLTQIEISKERRNGNCESLSAYIFRYKRHSSYPTSVTHFPVFSSPPDTILHFNGGHVQTYIILLKILILWSLTSDYFHVSTYAFDIRMLMYRFNFYFF